MAAVPETPVVDFKDATALEREVRDLREELLEAKEKNKLLARELQSRDGVLNAAHEALGAASAEKEEAIAKIADYSCVLEDSLRQTMARLASEERRSAHLEDRLREERERNHRLGGRVGSVEAHAAELQAQLRAVAEERDRLRRFAHESVEVEEAMHHNVAAALEYKAYLEESITKNATLTAEMKRKDVMLAELEQAVLVLEGYRRTKADLDDVMNAFQKMYLDYRAEKADPTNTKSNSERLKMLEGMVEEAASAYGAFSNMGATAAGGSEGAP